MLVFVGRGPNIYNKLPIVKVQVYHDQVSQLVTLVKLNNLNCLQLMNNTCMNRTLPFYYKLDIAKHMLVF